MYECNLQRHVSKKESLLLLTAKIQEINLMLLYKTKILHTLFFECIFGPVIIICVSKSLFSLDVSKGQGGI